MRLAWIQTRSPSGAPRGEVSQRFDPRCQGRGLQAEQLDRASGTRDLAFRSLQRRPDVVHFELSDLGVGPHTVGFRDEGLGNPGGTGRDGSSTLSLPPVAVMTAPAATSDMISHTGYINVTGGHRLRTGAACDRGELGAIE
jgi:hypothetical protein